MLVKLFGKNFGCFRDEFELSLEALPKRAEGEYGYFEVPIKGQKEPLRLLRLAAIYGANASGKSTIVNAAEALRELVVYSAPRSQEGELIEQYKPFKLDPQAAGEPVELGCEVVVDDTVMAYSVSFTKQEVVSERIVEFASAGDRIWLERRGAGEINLPKPRHGRRGPTVDLSKVTRRNAAVLSHAAQLNQVEFLPLFEAISDSLRTLGNSESDLATLGYTLRRLSADDEAAFKRWVLEELLCPADFGITNISVREEEIDVPAGIFSRERHGRGDELSSRKLKIHRARLQHRGQHGDFALDLEDESRGTRKLLALAGPFYDVLFEGLTVFADELSSTLHPALLVALLSAVNGRVELPPSQIVIPTHDLTPLEHVLRRDQVFFTEKGVDGAATVFALADFDERKEHNQRKRYMEGRYGALPRLIGFDLAPESSEHGDG